METFMYTFSINVDEPLLKTNNPIFSPAFQTTFNGISFSWKLKFCSKTDKNNDRPALFLHADNDDDKCVDAKVQMLIIPSDITHIHWYSSDEMKKFSSQINTGRGWSQYSRFSFNNQIPKEIKIYSDNCFKILCKIYIPHKCFNRYLTKPTNDETSVGDVECLFNCTENFVLPTTLSDNFFNAAIGNKASDELCDLILNSSDGKSFYCHRLILACNSEIFKTMFLRSDLATHPENVKQYIIETEDINSDTLTEVLRYIYKKEFSPKVDKLLESCLFASEKYGLPDLKSKCIASLKFNLTQENVFDYLHLAENFSSESLKMGCFEILHLFDHIIDESKFKAFLSEHVAINLDMIKYLNRRFNVNLVV